MDAGLRAAAGAIAMAVTVGIVVTAVVGAVALLRRRRLRPRQAVGCLAAGYAAAVLTVTLWPATPRPGRRVLENLLAGPASLAELAVNVGLFLPLGLAVGWLASSTRPLPGRVAWVLALPLAVEGLQLAVAPLHRDPSVVDVVANMVGLAAGLVAGHRAAPAPAAPAV